MHARWVDALRYLPWTVDRALRTNHGPACNVNKETPAVFQAPSGRVAADEGQNSSPAIEPNPPWWEQTAGDQVRHKPFQALTAMTALATADLLGALPRLRRYARVLTGDARQADELLVDTVELARKALPRQGGHVPLRTRLFGMMHHLYDVGWAKTPRSRAVTEASVVPGAGSRSTGATALLEEFQALPVAEREALLLVAVEGMPYQEIASVLDVPVAAVVARVRRARELLRSANRSTPELDLGARE